MQNFDMILKISLEKQFSPYSHTNIICKAFHKNAAISRINLEYNFQ